VTNDLKFPSGNVKPCAYIDVLHVWLMLPISNKERRWLDRRCGKLRTARQLHIKEPCWFNPSYKQTFRLFQPSQEALEWLAKREDVLLTFVELALDYTTSDEWLKLALANAFNKHFVQRWHRSRESKIFNNFYGNANTGPRKPGLRFQWYTDLHSKATGEVNCFHLEAKCQGGAALRRIGIYHPRDLIQFDHGKFWRAQLTGSFFDCDHERLGRNNSNKRDGTKRRTPRLSRSKNGYVYNFDASAGSVLWRVYARHPDEGHFSAQRFVDSYGRGPYLLCICANNPHSRYDVDFSSDLPSLISAYLTCLADIEFCYPLRPRPHCTRPYPYNRPHARPHGEQRP
jgi:hypothetical protein